MSAPRAMLTASGGLWGMEEGAYLSMLSMVDFLSAPEVVAAYGGSDRQNADKPPYEVVDGVATVKLSGPLMKEDHWLLSFIGGTSTAKFAQTVAQAAADPNVKAILLDVDSPGGHVDGTEEAAEAVAAASKLKPTHAYVNGSCCSAAYWIASQARSIHSNASSATGSLGVRTGVSDTSGLFEKMGVKVYPVASGEHKTTGMMGTPVTESQVAEIQRQVDATCDVFKKAVSSGRKLKGDKVDALFTGAVWIGKDAAAKGLTDGVASRATVMSALHAYKPGRSAVHIAAQSAGEKTMEFPKSWEEFAAIFTSPKAEKTDDGQSAQAQPGNQLQPGVQVFSGELKTSAGFEAERKKLADELEASQKQREDMQKALEEMSASANRSVCESYMKQGLFTAAQLEENVKLRAGAPDVFDTLMKSRPKVALAADAISGDAAVDKVEQDASAEFTKQCRNYHRQMLGLPAAGGSN